MFDRGRRPVEAGDRSGIVLRHDRALGGARRGRARQRHYDGGYRLTEMICVSSTDLVMSSKMINSKQTQSVE